MPISPIIFKNLITQTLRQKPVRYCNSKGVIQSSVGLIFKIYSKQQIVSIQDLFEISINNVQLLFTQRAGFEKDRNAYNIVFPGGQCDLEENDFQACKRELFEQIGLKTDEQSIYVGQIPNNFYYLQKRGCKLYISCHIWILKQSQIKWIPKLNEDQLRQYRWVNFEQLLDPNHYILANYLKRGILDKIALKFPFANKLTSKVRSAQLPQLELGMQRNLWGITLWIWSYCLQMSIMSIQKQKVLKLLSDNQIDEIKSILQKIKSIKVQFEKGSIIKGPALFALRTWHQFYRIRPFTYTRKAKRSYIYHWFFVFITLMIFINFIM